MIARLHPSRLEAMSFGDIAHGRDDGGRRLTAPAALVALFGFVGFVPYPAFTVGANTGLQLGNILVLLLVFPAFLTSWWRRPFYLAPLLMFPVCLSLVKVAVLDGGHLQQCFKSLVVSAFSGLTLIAIQRAAPLHALWLLTGIAFAALLHIAVGAWQLHGFANGYFPLLRLYENPSFLSVQENVDTIVQYIRRPFGLFPEPSAMTSSLAPWTIFWIAESLGLVRLRQSPEPWRRALFVSAAIGSLALIIVSRSGHSSVTLVAVVVCAATWFIRSRATAETYVSILALFCVALPIVLWFGAAALGERVGRGEAFGDSSWQDRAASLRAGLRLVLDGDIWTMTFGVGPGLTSAAVKKMAGFEAVWSVLLPYLYQNGLIGAAAVTWVGRHFAHTWRAAGLSAPFAMMLFVWLVGIVLTTSYGQLLPLWVAMGWLTVWPAVCAAPEPSPVWSRLMLGRMRHQARPIGAGPRSRRPIGLVPPEALSSSNGVNHV